MSNEVATDQSKITPGQLLLNGEDPQERRMLLIERNFEMEQRSAMVYAKSDVVPAQYQNKIANCIIAKQMAERLNTGVLEIMQNLYVVHGRPAFSSAYMIARINTSGLIKGTLKFNFVGTEGQDDWGCYCSAKDIESGEEMKGPTIDIKMAKAEGWATKNGSKWKTMPEVMLRYRAAAFFARGCIPQAIMGMQTTEEVHDVQERDITPQNNFSSINEAFKPKALQSNETVDEETGEIQSSDDQEEVAQESEEAEPTTTDTKTVEPEAEPETTATNEAEKINTEESPAFQTLKKELLKTKTVEEAHALKNAPLIGRMKKYEVAQFGKMIEMHVLAIENGDIK